MKMSCSDSRLSFRVASGSNSRSTRALPAGTPVSVRDDLFGLLPDPCELTVFGRIALHRRIPVRHRFIEPPPEEMGSDRSHQLSDEIEYLIGMAPIEGAGLVLDIAIE